MTTSTKRATRIQRLSTGDLKPLASLIDQLALGPQFRGDAILYGADPVIRSPHHLGAASGMAQLLIGTAVAAIWHMRTGLKTNISIDIIDALHHLHQEITITRKQGSFTLEESLTDLVKQGVIDRKAALTRAMHPEELERLLA